MTCSYASIQPSSESSDCLSSWRRERRRTEIKASATDSLNVCPKLFSWWYDAYQLERHHPRPIQSNPHPIQTNFENRIYSLSIHCGPEYPEKPPVISFQNKVNLPSVNGNNGRVENLNILKAWKNTTTIENILVALKNEMVTNKGLKQPGEEDFFW